MFKENSSLRNFKGGSWDLRKNERRVAQASIAFPDRRAVERRGLAASSEKRTMSTDSLTWLSKSPLDE